MRTRAVLLLACLTCLPAVASAATPLMAPRPAEEVSASFDFTRVQIRYDLPGDRFYITRDIYAGSWAYESFYASLGFIEHTSYDDIGGQGFLQPEGDPGYLIAFGARGAAWRSGSFAVNLDFQFHIMNEKILVDQARYTWTSHEAILGAAFAWEQPTWRVHAGFDTVPYSNIAMKAPGLETMERSDFFIVHAGGSVDIGPVFLDADVQFLGAEGLRVGIGYAF